jgi:GT2 family glycosyltransferase
MNDERQTSSDSAFIIATRNRPEELVTSVESIVKQSVLPRELCIVDSSDETSARGRIEELCGAAGVQLRYIHPAPRALTTQRNLGIDETSGDPVFLLDDDIYMEPDCHEEILEEYARWGEELGGVRCVPVHPPTSSWPARVWRKIFGIGGWWAENTGRVRKGFWVEGISTSAGVRKTEAFIGYFMSYRRKVFDLERFDDALSGYAHKEDIDFSYRVSRRFTLVQTPKARCDHLKTPTARMSHFQLMRMNLGNQFYLHKKNMPQDFAHRAALWWGLVGLFVLNIGRAIKHRDHGLITGFVYAAAEQARGKGLIDPQSTR